jgi:hypothetical protein
VSAVKLFFISWREFCPLNDQARIPGLKVPGHAMIAWMRRPVQGRCAPAAPVARGNP